MYHVAHSRRCTHMVNDVLMTRLKVGRRGHRFPSAGNTTDARGNARWSDWSWGTTGGGRSRLWLTRRLPVFGCVLMDVQMPEMDGFECTAIIRDREQGMGLHLPIVAMTAHAMTGDEARCLAAGMDAYLSKPIDPDDLFDIVERHLAANAPVSRAMLSLPKA